jgi:plasmid stabilization system protein ParE
VRIVRSGKYTQSLQEIMRFISLDSKNKALKFRDKLDKQIANIINMPYKCRRSIYFDDDNIRDLIYKGYTVVYKIDEEKSIVVILGIKKYKEEL